MNPSLVLPVIFGAGVVAAFAVLSGLAAVLRRLRPAGATTGDDGRTLLCAVAAARPPTDWEGRMDRSFERMVRWTLLGLSAQQALAILALGAAAGGALLLPLLERLDSGRAGSARRRRDTDGGADGPAAAPGCKRCKTSCPTVCSCWPDRCGRG